jgi:hypothetical protein
VVWVEEGKSDAILEEFFADLGPTGAAQLQAASMDLHGAYAKVTSAHAPQVRVCADSSTSSSWQPRLDQVTGSSGTPPRHAGSILRRPNGRIRTNLATDLVKHTAGRC